MLRGTAPRSRTAPPRPPRPLFEEVKGIKGMRSTMEGSEYEGYVEWLHNCYPADPYNGGEIIARPGRQLYPVLSNGANQPVFSEEPVKIQMGAIFTTTQGGIQRPVVIAGGKFYALSASTYGWIEAVSTATLLAAGITLSAVNDYYAVMFNGKLIVVGSNNSGDIVSEAAWSWTGVEGSGITKLTNAGTNFFGKPAVYAAKLFFIRKNQKTIVWSEENNETLGYEAGGYANAWDLNQTSAEPITCLLGTNPALYVFRRSSIGAIYGGSAAEFSTTSTVDAISASSGTDSPNGVIFAGESVWYVDSQGRPAYFPLGGNEIVPLWPELERAFTPYFQDGRGYKALAFPNSEQNHFALVGTSRSRVAQYRTLDMVFFGYRYFASSLTGFGDDVLIGFHVKTKRAQTVWSFPTGVSFFHEIYDNQYGSGQYGLLMLDPWTYSYILNPNPVAQFLTPQTAYLDHDVLANLNTDVIASVIGPRHFTTNDEKRVESLDVEYIGWKKGGTIDVRWATPAILSAGGVETQTDQPESIAAEGQVVDDFDRNPPSLLAHAEIGFSEVCRWIAFGVSWAAQATRIRLLGWTVRAIPEGRNPRSY